jgi:type IV pilus assembly protein PilN
VILINLLPHRELARKRARDSYYWLLVLAVIIGALIAAGVYLIYQQEIGEQQSRNDYLTSQNTLLNNKIKDVTGLQGEIIALEAREQAVENLQINRNLPVHLFNNIVQLLPPGMYLNSIKQDGQNISFTGVAQSQERVSELLRNISSSNNQWLTQPDLIEIHSDQLALSPRDQRRVYDFTVRVMLGRVSQAASAQQTASQKKTSKGGA